jgi:hypothetical protein
MKADMEKMKSSLAQIKANVAKISDPVNRDAGRATWICGRFWSATWSRC